MIHSHTTLHQIRFHERQTRAVRLLLGALLLLMSVSSDVAWAAVGDGCFKTVFNADADGHDPANAYLLMLASYNAYENRINANGFDDFAAKFREKFTAWGMDEFDFLNIRKKTGDTQVMIMSNQKTVVVVFRGSEAASGSLAKTVYDWVLTDFNFLKKSVSSWGKDVRVHRGFYNALDIVYPQLKSLVQKHLGAGQAGTLGSATPVLSKRLWVTGHSLGAGITPLAAFRLAQDGIPVQGVVTYGEPRVGNKQFAEIYRTQFPRHQRWVDDKDIVTMVPFTWMKFNHLAKPNNLYADGSAQVQDQPFTGMGKASSHQPGMYLQRLYNLLSISLKDALPAPPAFNVEAPSPDPELEAKMAKQRKGWCKLDELEEDD